MLDDAFILFDFGCKQQKRALKIHDISTCRQRERSPKSVNIQDHLNHIYHHGGTCISLFTQHLNHISFLKRAKIATLRAPGAVTGARQHVKQEVVLLSWPSVSSSGSAWLLLFLYPTAFTTTSAAAALADSMLITLGSCNSRLLRLVTGALIWVSWIGQLDRQDMVWETAHAGAIKTGEHTRFWHHRKMLILSL